jgi:hypothetical protein
MMASMQALTEAINAHQEEDMPMEEDQAEQAERNHHTAYFADDTDVDNPPELATPKSTSSHDSKLEEMRQQCSEVMEAIKPKEQEEENTTQDEKSHQEIDELLKAETDMLNRATLRLQQAREERPPREESTSDRSSQAE